MFWMKKAFNSSAKCILLLLNNTNTSLNSKYLSNNKKPDSRGAYRPTSPALFCPCNRGIISKILQHFTLCKFKLI